MKTLIVLSLFVVGNLAYNVNRNRIVRNVQTVDTRDNFDQNVINQNDIDQNRINVNTQDRLPEQPSITKTDLVDVHDQNRLAEQLAFRAKTLTDLNRKDSVADQSGSGTTSLVDVHAKNRLAEQLAFREKTVQQQASAESNRNNQRERSQFLDLLTFRDKERVNRFPTEENMYMYYKAECDKIIPNVHDDKTYRDHLACLGNKLQIVNDQGMMDISELRAGLEGLMDPDIARSMIQRCLLETKETHDSPTVELLYCIDQSRGIVKFNPIGSHLD